MSKIPGTENRNFLHPEVEATETDEPKAVLEAAGRGVAAALRRHKLLGHSIVAWRNGKIVRIPPEEIEI
jgi:hypothetical protein